jgi:integrase
MRRHESSIPLFQQRIPKDVLAGARGAILTLPIGDKLVTRQITDKAIFVKISLGTREPSEAKIRHTTIAAYLEGVWQALRNGPTELTHKQSVALSGEIYKTLVAILEDNPPSPEFLETMLEADEQALAGELETNSLMIDRNGSKKRQSLETKFGGFVDYTLSSKALIVNQTSRDKLLNQIATAMSNATKTLKRYSDGDYSPDNTPSRFPEWEIKKTAAKVSITKLYDLWKGSEEQKQLSESTFEAYERTIRYFKKFLGHDDATRVTPDDVVAYKDFRLQEVNPRTGKAASPRTVKDGDLVALKSIFGWAVNNKKLSNNPAKDISIKVRKKAVVRDAFFSRSEASSLLKASKAYKGTGREYKPTVLAKRWMGWICAYTGARVGEIAQLRRSDIYRDEEDGIWVFRITPEAGGVKNKKFRIVPIHAHLIEEGIIDALLQRPDGYLFLSIKEGEPVRGARKACTNRVREFMRTIIIDPNIQPIHGWRHSFKTYGLEAEIEGRVLDILQGHSLDTDGKNYGGDSTLRTRGNAIKKFPKYPIE